MKIKIIIALLIIIGAVFIYWIKGIETATPITETPIAITPTTMQITSPAFQKNQKIPSKYTCDSDNINPELVFSEVPKNTKSLTLICHDPDAPGPSGWTHWVIINMDPGTTGIGENAKPNSGLETATDFGKPGYGGPCPPSGSHRYYFYLYALDTALDLENTATREDVEAAMEGHIIEKAELIGTYERK